MKLFDISAAISPAMAVYKDREEKKPRIEPTASFDENGVRESRISIDSHTGTHVDAPAHMLKDGKGLSSFNLVAFLGPCRVLDCSFEAEKISHVTLEKHDIKEGERIILKTKNSFDAGFNPNFIFLDMTGAAHLAERKVALVGIDGLGIERAQPNHETHKILLEKNIPILEGLRLADIEEGNYYLSALPLRIDGGDAAPVRAVLVSTK